MGMGIPIPMHTSNMYNVCLKLCVMLHRRQSTFWRLTLSVQNGARSMPYWPSRSAWQKSNRWWSSFIHVSLGMQLNRSDF